MTQKVYRIRNWKKYNKSLVQRGNITLWLNENSVKKWYAKQTGGKGRPLIYSDSAIELCIIFRVLHGLPYRSCQGFVAGLFALMKLPLSVPSYSQLCRRQKELKTKLQHQVKGRIHVVLDATGLKIYGEGEWKVKQHGYSKRRMWRKLHIGLDVESQEVVMMELTDNHVGENKLLSALLNQYDDDLSCVGGDKGYDSYECHETVGRGGATSAIAVQRKAKIRKRYKKNETLVRDDIVRRIREVGRKQWKREVCYHRRSLVETAFSRYKQFFGEKLRSHTLENQKIETIIGCNILNQFTQLGMPITTAQ